MEQMTGSPWPSHGQANRNQEPRDTGIYGRLGADHLGRKTYNSYMYGNKTFNSCMYNIIGVHTDFNRSIHDCCYYLQDFPPFHVPQYRRSF